MNKKLFSSAYIFLLIWVGHFRFFSLDQCISIGPLSPGLSFQGISEKPNCPLLSCRTWLCVLPLLHAQYCTQQDFVRFPSSSKALE